MPSCSGSCDPPCASRLAARSLGSTLDGRIVLALSGLQARAGAAIRARLSEEIVGRLIESGCARWQGDKVLLTEEGIRLWEGSPLFIHGKKEAQAARSKPNIRLARSDAMPAE